MSTITESCRRAARFVCAASLILAAWFSLMALSTLAMEPARVVMFAPGPVTLAAAARSDGRIVDSGAGFAILQGRQGGFVRKLYAAGAWLVLPALSGGCRGLDTRSARS